MKYKDYYLHISHLPCNKHDNKNKEDVMNTDDVIKISYFQAKIKETSENEEEQKAARKDKNRKRKEYIEKLRNLAISPPSWISPSFSPLPDPRWLALGVEFTLQRPWYSKDDSLFHVMDNPLRKDRVFGVPFMSASGWKGLLRWACRMTADLVKYLAEPNNTSQDWQDPDWILHLFGNDKPKATEAHSHFHQGCLCFYPTWFERIGFEVINPHSRERRAGTQPIYYEVVPPGTKGHLCLLYAPPPEVAPWPEGVKPDDALCRLIDAIDGLLTTWGISAKRTAGWGTARVDWWAVRKGSEQSKTRFNKDDIKAWIREQYKGSA